ncbi:MAG: hypothetical protein ACRDT4_02650 [Micromonosporaceae bacterium]
MTSPTPPVPESTPPDDPAPGADEPLVLSPEQVRRRWRAFGAGVFLIWALYLYLAGPSLTLQGQDNAAFTVRCQSLASQGFDGSKYLDDQNTVWTTYQVTDGVEPEEEEGEEPLSVERRIMERCDRALVHRGTMIGVLGIPISVLTIASLRPYARRDEDPRD